MRAKKVKIVYYTGTGSTARVAKCFESSFTEIGYEVDIQHLSKRAETKKTNEHELLLILYAVHAFNAPEPVYKWIDGADFVKDIPAVVISVSGGGEVIPNTACRVSSIKRLEKKGYRVIYEEMLVMPSN